MILRVFSNWKDSVNDSWSHRFCGQSGRQKEIQALSNQETPPWASANNFLITQRGPSSRRGPRSLSTAGPRHRPGEVRTPPAPRCTLGVGVPQPPPPPARAGSAGSCSRAAAGAHLTGGPAASTAASGRRGRAGREGSPRGGFSRGCEEASASLRRASLAGGGDMEAPWRQRGRGRGRARSGDGLAARAGAAARLPAPRTRGGACVAAAGSSGEGASGECRVLPPHPHPFPGPAGGCGVPGWGAGCGPEPRRASGSPCECPARGRPRRRGEGRRAGGPRVAGGPRPRSLASRRLAVRRLLPAGPFWGQTRRPRAAAGGSGLRPPQGARSVPFEQKSERVKWWMEQPFVSTVGNAEEGAAR